MTAIAQRADSVTTDSHAGVRTPPWMVALVSRVIVLGAGIAGALRGVRADGWAIFDPTRTSSHLGTVGDALASTAVRWDSIHYLEIAQHGYSQAANTIFFPLYPLLIHGLSWVIGSDVVSGIVISAVAFVVALVLLHRLAREELGQRAADATVALLAFAPLSLFFTALYTESLFLALSVGAFYLARRQRFLLASAVATAAALTRIPGVLLVAPLGMMYLQSHGRDLQRRLAPRIFEAGSLLLPVLGVAGLFAYLHGRGYGWLAPITNQEGFGHGHSMVGPLVTLWRGIDSGLLGLMTVLKGGQMIDPSLGDPYTVGFQNLVYLIVLGICVAGLVSTWRRLPKPYFVYAALILIVCLWSPSPIMPMLSIDRYALVVFPLWMAAAAWLSERRITTPVLLIGGVLLFFYAYEFSCWVFVG